MLCLHNTGTLEIYMNKFDCEKYFLKKKRQLFELRHFFLHVFNRSYDCAMIGHTQLFF